MYCPKCKNEYRKGIEICPECNIELVEELDASLDMIELFRCEDENMVNEVGRYFEHIELSYEIETDEETAEIIFKVAKSEIRKAKQEAATVIKVYQEQKLLNGDYDQEIAEEEEEKKIDNTPQNAFVSAKDRTNDYRSSGIMFIIMGIIIIVFALLNMLGVISFIAVKMSQILLMILGVACIIGGIASVIRSKALLLEVSGEEEMIKKIKDTLAEKYPPLVFAEMMENSDTTPELRYIQVQEEIKKTLTADFPNASSRMLDDFIEEYTDGMFN